VELYHIKRSDFEWLKSAPDLTGGPSSELSKAPLVRLGSVVSDRNGSFSVEYTPAQAEEMRPNLVLVVCSAEGDCDDGSAIVLHISAEPRVAATTAERYRILVRNDLITNLSFRRMGLLEDPVELKRLAEKVKKPSEEAKPKRPFAKEYKRATKGWPTPIRPAAFA
jgi:hypothetical protein